MSGRLPVWLEPLFGIEPSGTGEGTLWRLTWSVPGWIPGLFLLIFPVAALGFVVYCYIRESTVAGPLYRALLALVRVLLIFVVAYVMISRMVLTFQRSELPYVVVMIDTSASMNIADDYDDEELAKLVADRVAQLELDESTRLNLAKSVVLGNDGEMLEQMLQRYKLRVYFVDGSARSAAAAPDEVAEEIRTLEADGESSQLGSGIRTVLNDLRGTPPAAIVLLSDGITTEGETISEVSTYARRKDVPLLLVGLGSRTPQRNLRLSDLVVDEVVFVNDVVTFESTLTSVGYAGRRVQLVLREKDNPAILARQEVTVGADRRPQKVHVSYRPTRVGRFEYVVELEKLEKETKHSDNMVSAEVSVRKEQIRVLMVQSYPSFEYRYLKHLLERDSTVVLHAVLQEADLKYAELDKSALRVFPVNRDELFKYDTIVFGDVDPAFLSATVMQNIADFVQVKGGGLVFIAGQRFTPREYASTPLADLFPVDLATIPAPHLDATYRQGFVVRPTDIGLASPGMQLGDSRHESAQIWSGLPPVYWCLQAPDLKPGARVLADHPSRVGSDGPLPMIAMHYVGAGKVLMHMFDATWRWRFRVGDVFFARYWVQSIRYLSRTKLLGQDRTVRLSVDPAQARRGTSVRVRARFLDERRAPAEDDGVTVMVQREGHANRRVTLKRSSSSRGMFEGVLSRPADGRYTIWIVNPTLEGKPPTTTLVVEAPPGEQARTRLDEADLRRSAELTGGKFFRIDQAHRVLDEIPEGHMIPMNALEPKPIWYSWLTLSAFLGLLVLEWIMRKRRGML